PAWSRDQENEADALAMDLLLRSNMPIDSYENVFARLERGFDRQEKSRNAAELAAEQLQASLKESLETLTSDNFNSMLTNGGVDTAHLQAIGTGLIAQLGNGLIGGIRSIFSKD